MERLSARTAALLVVAASALAVAGCGRAAGPKEASRPPGAEALSVQPGRSDAALARLEAERILHEVGEPPGCRRVGRVPTRASSRLSQPLAVPGTPNLAVSTAMCVSSLSPARVIGWYRSHALAGARVSSSGQSDSRGVTTAWMISYAVPSVRVLTDAGPEVSVASLPNGGSVVRIDALVVYSPSKPPSEKIPTDVTRIVIAVTPGHGRRVVRAVVDGTTISRVVSVVNALLRPSYPSNPGGPAVTTTTAREQVKIEFYGTSTGSGRTALLAVVDDHPLLGGETGNVDLSVGGRTQPILLDGGALARLASAITGTHLNRY